MRTGSHCGGNSWLGNTFHVKQSIYITSPPQHLNEDEIDHAAMPTLCTPPVAAPKQLGALGAHEYMYAAKLSVKII
jgi:hypothetical protein